MLLAARHILGPVAGVGLLVVKEPADAELLGCCAVPAGPVARAGSLVAKDAVEPVAVLSALWRIHFWPRLAVDIVGVVALADKPKPSISSKYKTVGAALKEALTLVAVVVEVTSRLVADGLCPRLAGFLANKTSGSPGSWSVAIVGIGSRLERLTFGGRSKSGGWRTRLRLSPYALA
jgi:hypothetical protein